MYYRFFFFSLCLIALTTFTYAEGANTPKQKNLNTTAKQELPAGKTGKANNPKDTNAGPSPPATKEESPKQTMAKVLEPGQFFGQAAIGYACAQACPEVVAKLFCYCGCDITDNHSSLLDCFTSPHGVDCHICQEEAVLALKLHRDSTPVAEIQKIIDEKYASEYPFEQDSPAYKRYKSQRLYISKEAPLEVKFGETKAGPELPGEPSKPKLKPGKTANPTCCSGKDH